MAINYYCSFSISYLSQMKDVGLYFYGHFPVGKAGFGLKVPLHFVLGKRLTTHLAYP